MPEADAYLRALQSIGEKFDAGLNRVHDRMDEIGTNSAEMNQRTSVFAERLSNHIGRGDIHHPEQDGCRTSSKNSTRIEEHITNHSSIVKKDIGSLIGVAILGALLLAGGAYVATQVFGGP